MLDQLHFFRWSATAGLVIAALSHSLVTAAAPAPSHAEPAPLPPRVKSQVKLPIADGDVVVRSAESSGHKVLLDLSGQVLRLEAPKQDEWREAGDIRAGDTIKTTKATRLMRGTQALASVKAGQSLPVTERKEGWVRTVSAGNSGWLPIKDVELEATDPLLHATLGEVAYGRTLSYAALAQKCKQFDDGLYAAVELAAQEGQGDFAGKRKLLAGVCRSILADSTTANSKAGTTILGAGSFDGISPKLPDSVRSRVETLVADFHADALRSKPIGFYTWSSELKKIFQQDRLLQAEIEADEGGALLLAALRSDQALERTYDQYLNLVSRLTNPLKYPDLRSLDDQATGDRTDKVRFFPPSMAHESELIMRLYGNQPIPEGFNLADELIAQVQAGKIDLTPKETSGWYDYQTWSLEPLILPERTSEAEHLEYGKEYRKLLAELFKGVLALTRETHIKQLDIPEPAAAAFEPEEKVKLFIGPEVTVEPLAAAYYRRALAYQFVRGVLSETFGEGGLAGLHRQTAKGPLEQPLNQELESMEALLHGAYVVASRQIGMTAASNDQNDQQLKRDGDANAAAFLDWAANLPHDIDVGQDARMMVPVFYDQQRKQTKVWAFLGWSPRNVSIEFVKHPKISKIENAKGEEVLEKNVEVHFHGASETLMYPIVAEVYVTQILNRDEFRQHCDLYKTKGAILSNLR